jgi:hypothetical protein
MWPLFWQNDLAEGYDIAGEAMMSQTFDAIYDGSVFRPAEPLELQPNTRVRVTIEVDVPSPNVQRRSFLETAQTLNLQGPPDWSARLS